MRIRVIALGHRTPAWVAAGWADYTSRLPHDYSLELCELKPQPRDRGHSIPRLLSAEAERIGREWSGDWVRVALDQRGRSYCTRDLAARLAQWRDQGRAVAFAIGSADGLHESILRQAELVLSLSALTLPHALVRVILAEQVYRAVTLLSGHPYHRE